MRKDRGLAASRALLDRALHPVAMLLYGSRACGTALPESDLDVFPILDELPGDDATAEAVRLISGQLGFRVDLKVTTRRGAAFSHVMSPEWRVAPDG